MSELPFSVPERREAAVKTLSLVRKLFCKLNVQFWLSHGTLLGMWRSGDFIPHDSDIDLGIWDSVEDHGQICDALVLAGFVLVHELGSKGHGHQYAFWSPFGVYIDLFFYVEEEDHCWMCLWKDGQSKKMVFPRIKGFHLYNFHGEWYDIPANTDAILTANYGDWHTPVAPVERGGEWDWAMSPKNFAR